MNKQIEEMANIINEMPERNAHYYAKDNRETIQIEAFADCFAIAKALYNAGYIQPIKKDDIVLSKTEYNKILESKEPLRGWIYRDGFKDGREGYSQLVVQLCDDIIALKQENKEKAREILQEVKQRICDREIEAERILRYIKLDELAKKHGVEVE